VARQLRRRRKASDVTLADVIGTVAVLLILAAISVPSFQNVTDAYMRREGLRQVQRIGQ
jgi:Tfp pilus assembly protein PilE